MRKLTTFLLIGFMIAAATPAVADAVAICEGIAKLQLIHSRSKEAQSDDNPTATVEILYALEQKISEDMNSYADPEVIRATSNLSALVAVLRQSGNGQHLLSDAAGPTMFWNLYAIMGDLAAAQRAFGCDPTSRSSSTPEPLPAGQRSISSGQKATNNVSILAPKLIYAWVLLLIGIVAFGIIWRKKNRRADERKICNIVLHVVYGEQCTVTRIFDISQSGLKMEASAKDVEKKWLDFHFAGHKVEGKIVWRSKLYAGVKFRKRLSKEVLDEVMATNCSPVSQSGIEKTSAACFHDGCHLDCPLHLPTVIFLKAHGSGMKNGPR